MDTVVCFYCHNGRTHHTCELYGDYEEQCRACGGTGQLRESHKNPERMLCGKYKSIEEWIRGEIEPKLDEMWNQCLSPAKDRIRRHGGV